MINNSIIKTLNKTAVITTAVLALCCCNNSKNEVNNYDLAPPFDVNSIRKDTGKMDTSTFICKDSPKPIDNMFFSSMYEEDSENSSIVDPEAYKKYKEKTKPIKTFEAGLIKNSNRYIISKPQRQEIAACVLEWLTNWANGNALLGKSNGMGDFVRKWTLGTISTSYIQIRNEPELDKEQIKKVQTWIRTIAERVIADFSIRTDMTSRNNNHIYWAAWGVMVAGIALDDRKLFDWAIDKATQGINQIQADGTLPMEIIRGPKAYNYHHFAAIPLFMLANAADKNGVNLYALNNEGLRRLARILLENMEDQSYFEKLTGEKQNLDRTISSSNMTWLEPYYDRYHDPMAIKWIVGYRPFKHSRVGGNATLLYGISIN